MEGFVVIAPIGCAKYFTAGEKYKAFPLERNYFLATDDTGQGIYCKVNNCNHLNGGNWVLTGESFDYNPETELDMKIHKEIFNISVNLLAEGVSRKDIIQQAEKLILEFGLKV